MSEVSIASCAPDATWTIREVAARTGITTHTLRYYERIGLVQPVARAKSGHRRYGEADLRWLELVKKLHATDMSIRKMLEYARLLRRGETTVAARRQLLDAHRREVEEKLAQMRATLGVIEKKIELYDRSLGGACEGKSVAAGACTLRAMIHYDCYADAPAEAIDALVDASPLARLVTVAPPGESPHLGL